MLLLPQVLELAHIKTFTAMLLHVILFTEFFQFKRVATTVSSINSQLSQYDVIFIDEILQVSVDLFHHVISTINVLNRCPILVLCGDFCQHQPLAT